MLYTFSISFTVFETFRKKKNILKKVCQELGVSRTSLLGSKYVENVCVNWELSLPLDRKVGQYFP